MSRLALILVLLVAVLAAQGKQAKGKRKHAHRRIQAQEPNRPSGANTDNEDYYEEELGNYEEYYDENYDTREFRIQ